MNDPAMVWVLAAAAVALLVWPMLRTRLSGVRMVSAEEVRGALERGERVLLLDVRTAGEFRGAGGHIRDAVNIPVDAVAGRIAAVQEAAGGGPVVVVCQSGMRAVRAAQTLKGAGMAEVAVLRGGMAAWAGAGLPVRRGG